MKKLFKRTAWVMFALAVTMNIAAGGSRETGAAPETTGKKTFSILSTTWGGQDMPPDIDANDNKWVNIYKKELPDIDINWIIVPPGTLGERLNVMIGSGDYPDVLPMNMAQMIDWSSQGLIQNIDGMYESSYQNIYDFLSEDDLKPTRYNGHTYGIAIPNNRLQNPFMMALRTDWLQRLGLEMPKTIDELYNVLRAFTFDDPDGNGQDDTYGIAGTRGFNGMQQVFEAFGVQPGAFFTRIGDQLVPDFIRPEMKDAIAFFARLYREGILDKDTLVMDGNQLESKVMRGLVGMFGQAANGVAVRIYPNMLKANPNAKIAMFIPPPAPDGNIYMPIGRNGGAMRGVSVKCKYPDAVMYFFNWLLEQDTSTQPLYTLNADKIINGVIGVHTVTLDNRFVLEMVQADQTPEARLDMWRMAYRTHSGTTQILNDDLQFEISQTRIDQDGFNPVFLEAQRAAAEYGRPNAVVLTGPIYTENMTDIMTYWDETISSIITGAKPISAFDDFTKFFYDNNGQKIIDEAITLNR